MMTTRQLQDEILRLKKEKKKTSAFLPTHIRARKFWRWQIIQEILTD